MRCKLFILIVFGIFLIGNVIALTTIVEVKTLPHHSVIITPISTNEGFNALAQPVEGFSGKYGDIMFELDFDGDYFDLNFVIKDGDNVVLRKKVREDFVAGNLVNIEVLPEGIEPLVKPEETVVEEIEEPIEEEVVEEALEDNSAQEAEIVEEEVIKKFLLNGYSIIEENKPMVNSIYYSVLGFTALLLIFLTIRKNGRKMEKIEKKKGEIEEINEEDEDDLALEKAKEKVKELEAKKSEKIAAVKKKLIEDQKELLRLRGVKEQGKKETSTEDLKKRLEEKLNGKEEY